MQTLPPQQNDSLFEKFLESTLRSHTYAHIYATMKTTVEIDEDKLDAVMATGGFKTRKDTIDWALTEALRIATINKIVKTPWTMEEAKAAVDPSYDVIAMRNISSIPIKYSKPARSK